MADPKPKNAPAAVMKPTGWDRSLAEINATIRKAEGGDAIALEEVKRLFDRPGTADILAGNVARESLRMLVQKQANKNPVIKEAITKKLDEMRGELSGQNPSPLEKLLVERVLAAWLHLHYLEGQYACRDSMSLELGGYYERSISAAQKRYLAAIKGLAEVRKLALPALQVNIAKKQVNVAAATVATT